MPLRKTINKKRLLKNEVKEIIKGKGKLHEEYTKFFEETYASGYVKRDLVYELNDGNFLYVFDENESYTGGKGDIYPREYFFRFVRWNKRVKEDYANNRGSSVGHWKYYSKLKTELINNIDDLIEGLGKELEISLNKLDRSYKSLDLISEKTEAYGIDRAMENIYDNLVCYVGEVLIKRVVGEWRINQDFSGGEYPYVDVGLKNVQYMPINIVWNELHGLEKMNLRKETGNEAKKVGFKANFERQFGDKIDKMINKKESGS